MAKSSNPSFKNNRDHILWTIILLFILLLDEIALWICCEYILKTEANGLGWVIWVLVFFMLLLCIIACGVQILNLRKIRKNEPEKKATFALTILLTALIYSHMIAATIFSFWFILKSSIWYRGFEIANYDAITSVYLGIWVSTIVLLACSVSCLIVHTQEK